MSQKAIFLFKPWLPQFGFSIYGLFIEECLDEPGYFLTLRSFRYKVVSLHHKVDSLQLTFRIKQFKTI